LLYYNQESIHCTTKNIAYFYNATDLTLSASHNCENYISTVLFISGYTICEELIRGKIKITSESTLDYPAMDLGKGGPV
jgi:hypothetical protein